MEIKGRSHLIRLGWAAAALAGSMSAAWATPTLSIQLGQGAAQEIAGDGGGTNAPYAGGAGGGAGIPSTSSGWADTASFMPDPSFHNARGTSGWDASYLWLSQSSYVTFQFMGGGDSILRNQFFVAGMPLANQPMFVHSPTGGNTNPCPVSLGALAPTCDKLTQGQIAQNEWTLWIDVAAGGGYVPFWYVTGEGVTVSNDGSGNLSDETQSPGFMLAADPYQTTTAFDCVGPNASCSTVYVGLADRSRVGPGGAPIDHDYQDMGVRISVPEPGSMTLLALAIASLGFTRRRRSA